VLDGAVRRGSHGMTMEIGHLRVRDVAASEETESGRNARCECGELGHLDAIATPARLAAELGVEDWRAVATGTEADPRTLDVFDAGGAALGRALASLATLTDPGRLVLYLPPELAAPACASPGARYRAAVEREMAQGYFSASAVRLDIRPLHSDEASLLGARAAGLCLLHAFIEHARGRDS
jgi:predicted NBD/HSP70 family sugar kinase